MTKTTEETINALAERHPDLAERIARHQAAFASIPEEKKDFYAFVYWLIGAMREVGTFTGETATNTIHVRKHLAASVRHRLSHFCNVMQLSDRNLVKLAEPLDKFLKWFRDHGMHTFKNDAQSLIGYISTAESNYAILKEKEAELKDKAKKKRQS